MKPRIKKKLSKKLQLLQELAKATKKARDSAKVEQLKDEGVIQWHPDKGWVGQCVRCEEITPIWCDPAEFDPNHHYCGGSPRCCP